MGGWVVNFNVYPCEENYKMFVMPLVIDNKEFSLSINTFINQSQIVMQISEQQVDNSAYLLMFQTNIYLG